jgi:hypothetical protein
MSQIPEAGFLRLRQIIGDKKRGIPGIVPVAASQWWAGCRTGRFPQPVKLGLRTTAWRADDIRKLIEILSGGGDSPGITQSPTIARRGRVPDGAQKSKAKDGKGRR